MLFMPVLKKGILLRRYKRFLADIELAQGQVMTIHCPNTGSMRNCVEPGAPAWYSTTVSKTRKYPCTWEIATTPSGHLAGINTQRANTLVHEAITSGLIPSLSDIQTVRAEVPYGQERSRIDFLVETAAGAVYLEVKNVTLCEGEGDGYFPDAVSTRGTRHLRELIAMVESGHRGILAFCVQHSGIERVAPAQHIDPAYAKAFKQAVEAGVEVFALGATISASEIVLDRTLPVVVD